MRQDMPPDAEIEDWLKSLGITCLCQWDVLVFLHRHLASLVSGEHIARLLGYPTADVVSVLESLECLGLVERSRVDQGVRLYRLATPVDSPRCDALGRLLTVAASRAGRLFLADKLRRGAPPEGTNGHSAAQPREGRVSWLKAI